MLSSKNAMLSQSGQDLGLGDQLKAQVESEVQQRKKKLMQTAGLGMAPSGVMGQAASALGLGGGING
jgi:hypothetical protein